MIDLTFLHRFWYCPVCANIIFAENDSTLKILINGYIILCDVCQRGEVFEKCWKGGDMTEVDPEEGKVKLSISYSKQDDYLKVTITVVDFGDLPSSTIFIQNNKYVEDDVKVSITEGETHIISRRGPAHVVKNFAANIKEKVKEAVRVYRSLKLPENENFEI